LSTYRDLAVKEACDRQPFDDDKVEEFINRWYDSRIQDDALWNLVVGESEF
jgi:hypothetical protein